jgi:hypothetical protein
VPNSVGHTAVSHQINCTQLLTAHYSVCAGPAHPRVLLGCAEGASRRSCTFCKQAVAVSLDKDCDGCLQPLRSIRLRWCSNETLSWHEERGWGGSTGCLIGVSETLSEPLCTMRKPVP